MLAFRNFIFTLFLPGIHPAAEQQRNDSKTGNRNSGGGWMDECVGGCTAAAVRGRSRRVDKDYYVFDDDDDA